jgi:NADH:ubiquinone oxidoreductase subunit 4 (subunit M)
MTEHLLSINLLIALAGLLFIALTRSDKKAMIRTTAVIVGGLQLWIAFEILFGFDPLETALQFTERIRWIAALRIEYYIGIDSTNLIFIVLTALIFFLSVLISGKDDPRTKEYFLILLMIDLGLTGTFAAMNLFLFFIFLGLTGFGVYLMIGMWSGSSESNAVNRFGLFFILGYIFILLGLILIYHNNNLHTLNFSELAAGVSCHLKCSW